MFNPIRDFNSWTRLMMETALLTVEAQQVIAMRLAKVAAGGPDVPRESQLMVTEKMAAMAASGQMVMQAAIDGQSDMGAAKVVRHYRSKVRANRKRLAK